jgi:hypothetical protein
MRNNVKMKFLNSALIVLASVLISSCGNWTVPSDLTGQWKSDKCKITVRTEPKLMKFEFWPDSAVVILNIKSDYTVSGSIGTAPFENGRIRKNKGNPKVTGIAYIVECGKIGKIFDHDPLDLKEVEIWIAPLGEKMNAELRFTEGMAVFPMGDIVLTKVKTE